MSESPSTVRYRYPRTHRLRSQREFDAVYQGGIVRNAGPLRCFAMANALGHHRLGLNVSKRVGNAVRRNRVKRLIRESFRLLQHTLPGAYDVIVIARPHPTAALEDYQRWLTSAFDRLHRHHPREGHD